MKAKDFGFSNFRSIDSEGIYLNNLSKINIFIGKNNSGKSNVLRFIKTLSDNITDLSKFPNDLKNNHHRNNQNTVLHLPVKGAFFVEKNQINSIYTNNHYRTFNDSEFILKFQLGSTKILNLNEIFSTLKDLVNLFPFMPSNLSGGNYNGQLIEIESRMQPIVIKYIQDAFKNVIYIPHLRFISETHKIAESTSLIDGSNIISELHKMQTPLTGEELNKVKFNKIKELISDLLYTQVEVEIPPEKDHIIVTINNTRLPLDFFGTGIHQLVLICSALVVHENSIFCIEEPENNLHPELQRKFLNFLDKTNNIYFITTHSNVFIENYMSRTIYHVNHDTEKSTIEYCDTNLKGYLILDALGYKASDILQTNGIIWVEGPSDRILITKWIKLLDPNLIPDVHFTIMYYGGKLLSNLSFDAEKLTNELVPLHKINKNIFIIMDRDGFSSVQKLNKTKRRVNDEIGEGKYWVTKGREIENYITGSSISNWLKIESLELDPDTKIGEQIKKIENAPNYDSDKVKYMTQISQYINQSDLETLDLKQNLVKLITIINLWNHIKVI